MTTKVALITGITGQDDADLAEFLLAKGYMTDLLSSAKNRSRGRADGD